jgi:hypothetical protein
MAKPPKTPYVWTADRIIALSAMLISTCALVVSVLQTRIMQAQQEKSVWPNLSCTVVYGWAQKDSIGDFSLIVKNNGIGPALVKDIVFTIDGKEYRNEQASEILSDLADESILSNSETQIHQSVILPGIAVDVYKLTDDKQGYKMSKKYRKEYENTGRFKFRVHYEDVYGNTFVSNSKY